MFEGRPNSSNCNLNNVAVRGASFRAAAAAPRRAGPAGRVFLARERWGAAAGSAPRGGAGVFEGRPNSSNYNLNNVAVRGASFRAAAAAPRRAGPATPRGREHVGTPARRPHLPEAANMWARPRAAHISPRPRTCGHARAPPTSLRRLAGWALTLRLGVSSRAAR